MSDERFVKLVEEQNGFEFITGYRNDVDHIMGGKGNTFWYTVIKGSAIRKSFVGVLEDGEWKDWEIKGKGDNRTRTSVPSGTTIGLIEKEAYLAQDEPWVLRKTDPKPIEDSHPHYHFVKGFGDKGLDVSVQYGVSIAWSDLSDEDAGFHLRYVSAGNDVELP